MGSIIAFHCSLLILMFLIFLNRGKFLIAGACLTIAILLVIGQRIYSIFADELQVYEIVFLSLSIIISLAAIYMTIEGLRKKNS